MISTPRQWRLRAARHSRGQLDIRHGIRALRGFALIEVMVTIVLLAIGMLALAGLQARTVLAEIESYQRTQALILAQDMADRIVANKSNAMHYVGDSYGTGAIAGCSGSARVQLDLCTWGNAIRGATEKSGALNVGTLHRGRGCIAVAAPDRYQVIVAWQGLAPTVAPSVPCGQHGFGADTYRRTVVVPVPIADLGRT